MQINKLKKKLLYQILTHEKIWKRSCKTNTFKISTPTRNGKFDILGGSNSVSDILRLS